MAAGQPIPGTSALRFMAKSMQKLALQPAHSQPSSAAAAGPSAAAAAGRLRQSGGGHTEKVTHRSPLGAWQLPCVVQVTTSGPGQILARPVRHCVRSEVLQQVRVQRAAAAAAARGDAR
jgi:hypothetical protein